MRYTVTALTPLLVGGGDELSPIDYMVWKDQVNVLDQTRIFKLLARGPRLEGYLTQLRRAAKLDFASWGGFAQNFSLRRIPFEHVGSTAVWEKAASEHLFIPTFAANHRGPYLPGSALKGALRTSLVSGRGNLAGIERLAASLDGERLPRRPADSVEAAAGASQSRILVAADSEPIGTNAVRIFLTRTATLESNPGAGLKLAWKVSGRGTVARERVNEATPKFAEMAIEGTQFCGAWEERKFLALPELQRYFGWRGTPTLTTFVEAANRHAGALLTLQARYAQVAGLQLLQQSVERLQQEHANIAASCCLLNLGWGGGYLSKSSFLETENESLRKVLRATPVYARAIRSGLPFPKTRRIVFLNGQPAAFPGWVRVSFAEA